MTKDWFKPIGPDTIEIPTVALRQRNKMPNTTHKRPYSKRRLNKRSESTVDEEVQETVTQLFNSVKSK